MYIIEQEPVKVFLIGSDGSKSSYKSYKDFILRTNYTFAERHIIDDFVYFNKNIKNIYWTGFDHIYYIVRDAEEKVYNREVVLRDIKASNWKRYAENHNKRYAHKYRRDPVPYTGCRWYGNVYRHPRTTQERKWSCAHKKYVRPRRNATNLPDTWKDLYRSNVDNKSWKNQKKKYQWE